MTVADGAGPTGRAVRMAAAAFAVVLLAGTVGCDRREGDTGGSSAQSAPSDPNDPVVAKFKSVLIETDFSGMKIATAPSLRDKSRKALYIRLRLDPATMNETAARMIFGAYKARQECGEQAVNELVLLPAGSSTLFAVKGEGLEQIVVEYYKSGRTAQVTKLIGTFGRVEPAPKRSDLPKPVRGWAAK